MRFHANHVSTSVSGDYYQVMFRVVEDSIEPDSSYLIIQRQFEMPDDGECYVETHNEEYIGHFRLRRIEFAPTRILIEIDRPRDNLVDVSLSMGASDFAEAARVVKIISGETEAP